MKKNTFPLLCIIVFLRMVTVAAQADAEALPASMIAEAEARRANAITEYLGATVCDQPLSGNVLVAYHGDILCHQGFGLADAAARKATSPDTKYLIGSVTKSFTALAVMQLYEKQLLDLEDAIGKYLPGFPHADEITIHQLLIHTSGLPSDISELAGIDRTPSDMADALAMLAGKEFPLLSRPGTAFHYSNTGYVLLGFIIETVTGMRYGDYIRQAIFEPLGMADSGFGYDRSRDDGLAVSYDAQFSPVLNVSYIDMSVWPQAAGGLYSTAGDLYKWDRALYGGELADRRTLDRIFTAYVGDGRGSGYGYGWGIYHTGTSIPQIKDTRCVMHGGLYGGFYSGVSRFPEDDACIIILTNQSNTALTDAMNVDLIRLLFRPEIRIAGVWTDWDNEPFYSGATLLVPAEELTGMPGLAYQWDGQTVTISHGDTTIAMRLYSVNAAVNGEAIRLPAAPKTNSVAYIPFAFACSRFGFQYTYDPANNICKVDENP